MRQTLASTASVIGVVVYASLFALDLSRESTWGGPDGDEAVDLAVAPDGSVYVTGTTLSFGVGDRDAFLLKYSAMGALEWQRTYGSAVVAPFFADAEFGQGVAASPDGSVYITGHLSNGTLFLVKFDAAGNLMWQRTWGDAGNFANAVEVGADGSVYVAGGTFNSGAGQADALLLKFTSDGTLLWAVTWGGPSREALADMAIGADGGVYLVGETSSFFWNDAFVVKFAPDGTLLWQRDWGTMGDVIPNSSAAWGVATADDGSVYVTGTSNTLLGDMAVIKFDAAGTLLWERVAGAAFGVGFGVSVGTDGNVHVTGYGNFDPEHTDVFVLTLFPSGRAKEAVKWGGSGSEAGHSIGVAPDGGILVTGTAGAPTYVTERVPSRMIRPDGFLIEPSGTVTAAAGAVGIPLGITTTPDGSTTFGGAIDAVLLRLQP